MTCTRISPLTRFIWLWSFILILLIGSINVVFSYSVRFPARSSGGQHVNTGLKIELGERDYARDVKLGLSTTTDEGEVGYKMLVLENSVRWSDRTLVGLSLGMGEFDNGLIESGSQEFSLEGDAGISWRIDASQIFLEDYIGLDWFTNVQYSSVTSDPKSGSMSFDDWHVAIGSIAQSGNWYFGSGVRFSDSTMDAAGTSTTGNSVSVEGTAANNFGAFLSTQWYWSESFRLVNSIHLGDEINVSFGVRSRFGRATYGPAYVPDSE